MIGNPCFDAIILLRGIRLRRCAVRITIKTGDVDKAKYGLVLFFRKMFADRLGAASAGTSAKKPPHSFDVLISTARTKAPHMLLVRPDYYERQDARMRIGSALGDAMKFAKQHQASPVAVLLSDSDMPNLARIADAIMTAGYSFQDYRKKPSMYFKKLDVHLFVPEKAKKEADAVLNRIRKVFSGVEISRELANQPANVVTPEYLARELSGIAKKTGATCTVMNEKELKRNKFIGLMAVGGGSVNKPRMAVAHYKPEKAGKNAPRLAIVGKGITFDSGGISIKPSLGMGVMKADMGGAASVVGAFKAICALKPRVEVYAIVCAAENLPDGAAYRPGDILTYKNGTSVEVVSTDAEGRLVLADGLIRACELGATHIVDIATLTGACVVALGHDYTGLFGNDEGFIDTAKAASEASGEPVWHLPLPAWYREYLRSEFCDIRNSGVRWGGAITAAVFLSEFVEKGRAWCHLDIAPTFYNENPKREYLQAGATGVGVKLLVEIAESLAD